MISTCLLLILHFALLISSNVILPEYEHCNGPLGMESGSITDDELSSSSSHDMTSVGPQMARIRTELEGGAWCPEKPIGLNSYEYLQIEFRQLFFVNAIETQGRFGNGQGREFTEFYQIQYQRGNQSTEWFTYLDKNTNKTVLNGNVNTYVAEKRFLSSPILAKRIRIIPYSVRWRTVCMRVELYGCPFYGGIISYTTSPSTDQDKTYDGGIGKLVDGILGGNDHSWLGWNQSPVTIDFTFDVLRHFQSIEIYTMNQKYRSIEIQFDDKLSIKGNPSPVVTSISTVFLDQIDLNQYGSMFIGKQIRIQFKFDDELFLLTEIKFNSEPANLAALTSPSSINSTTPCLTVKTTNSTLESSSLVIFTFEWLTIFVVAAFTFGFLFLLFLMYCHHRRRRHRSSHRRFRQNNHHYYKSSQMTATTSGSCVSTSSDNDANTLPIVKQNNHLLLANNYDDLHSEQQSMGSYIYPITSSTSLLQTTPPSSLFKGEQYAVIDGNYSLNSYQHWPTTNTFHYASLDIGKIPSTIVKQNLSLFNCILPTEISPASKSSKTLPADVDQTKLMALRKLSETTSGEIYLGDYLINNQSKCVLIKAVKTNFIETSREKFLNELEILSRLNHSNLSCLFAVQLDLLYLIEEHSHFGTLQDYSRSLSNSHSSIDANFQKMNIYFAYQLANALQYLSHSNLIHGDVATRNCLFYSDLTIKLTDCAIALPQYQHEYWLNPQGQMIPLRWISPESLMSNATIHSDIYSFAVTLWEIWSRCSSLPYGTLANEEVYQRLCHQQSSTTNEIQSDCLFYFSVPPDCPKEIYDLLCECWNRDGTKRPNIDDITLYFRRQVDASRLN